VLNIAEGVPVYLASDPADMRKDMYGLAIEVMFVYEMDPLMPAAFAFCGKGRNIVKIIRFDGNGFLMLKKRLGRGHFIWPKDTGTPRMVKVEAEDLEVILKAADLKQRLAVGREPGWRII
jgi:transposase